MGSLTHRHKNREVKSKKEKASENGKTIHPLSHSAIQPKITSHHSPLTSHVIRSNKKMIKSVDNFLDEFNLNTPENTFLVGFSGGCDSLCLLDILHKLSQKYGFKVVALHLNHNWRVDESSQEEINCKRFCEKIGVEFISETLEDTGQRSENFAREARYNFFLKHAKNYQNSSVFTAHSRTDNAETLIYRIIKGTGINGLQGILPKRLIEDVSIYRPLLALSRQHIEDYCNSSGLVANSDSSNLDINYKRNFIRHKIMPLFDEINFNAEKSINSLAELAVSQMNIVNEYMGLIKKEVYYGDKLLSANFKMLSHDVKQQIIYDICLKEGLDYDRKKITNILEFIEANLNSKAGSRFSLTNNLWVFADSKYIYLITQVLGEKNSCEINISGEGEYKFPNSDFIFSIKKYENCDDLTFPPEDAYFAYADFDGVGLDLTLRTRREGDLITPFGMTGSMKLKKYLNSKSISQHNKDELILLCKGTEVLWVSGVGLSNKLRVVNTPSHVIELKS